MPWMVGEFEKNLAKNGFIVATLSGKRFKCPNCKSELYLIRDLDSKGELSPALFRCSGCEVESGLSPDKSGGVQPQLNMGVGGKKAQPQAPFTNPDDGGGWR